MANKEVDVVAAERPGFIIYLNAAIVLLAGTWHRYALESGDVKFSADFEVVGGHT